MRRNTWAVFCLTNVYRLVGDYWFLLLGGVVITHSTIRYGSIFWFLIEDLARLKKIKSSYSFLTLDSYTKLKRRCRFTVRKRRDFIEHTGIIWINTLTGPILVSTKGPWLDTFWPEVRKYNVKVTIITLIKKIHHNNC